MAITPEQIISGISLVEKILRLVGVDDDAPDLLGAIVPIVTEITKLSNQAAASQDISEMTQLVCHINSLSQQLLVALSARV